MTEGQRRYTFGPLERRGVLLGLDTAQVATILGGVLVAAAARQAVPGPAKLPAALAGLIIPVALAVVPVAGRSLLGWIRVWTFWRARRLSSPTLGDHPLLGTRMGPAASSARSSARAKSARRSALLPGVSIGSLPAQPGSAEIGVVQDRRFRSVAAVIPVRGRSFSLLDPAEQVQRLDSWRSVLASMGRPGTPLRRVQWLERSAPVGPGPAPRRPWPVPGVHATVATSAYESYQSLVTSAVPHTQAHDVWVVLSVGGMGRGRFSSSGSSPSEVLRRELRLLEGQLRNADLRAGAALGPEALSELIGRDPMAYDERWSELRLDDAWHATYWIAEWPRIEVSPDFLAPMLVCDGRRAVSVVMAPVPMSQAVREARSARTADLADSEIRSRAGFIPSARREREADGAVRREIELADGHGEFRFSGYVSVTASSAQDLETAAAEAEHAAQASRLELRRLYGRQAEAYTWSLPLARGLA